MNELIVMRVVHIVGGALWVGAVVFNGVYLIPALAASGPAAGPIMAHFQRRHFFTVLPVIAVLTLVSGARLLQVASDGFSSAYFASGSGRTYAVGGALALLAFLIGITIVRPSMNRATTLSGSIASATDDASRAAISAEAGALRRRGASANQVVASLLVAAVVAMAIGRYM